MHDVLRLRASRPTEKETKTCGKETGTGPVIWQLNWTCPRFLVFDVELDGWVKGTDHYTDSEASLLEHLPAMRLLLNECRVSAQRDRNTVAIDVVEETERILGLWEDCIRSRPIGDRECQ